MNTYDIYPEQTNRGCSMQEVSRDLFQKEIVTAEGKEYILLHLQQFPWTVLQVDTPKDMDEWRKHINAATTQGGYIEYVTEHYDHIVFSRGADKHIEINQTNADQIAEAIHEAIKDGARWWVLYGK